MPSNQPQSQPQPYDTSDANELRKFQCNRCNKSKLLLKKVADQQQHGFACEECWTAIERRSRYNMCQIG